MIQQLLRLVALDSGIHSVNRSICGIGRSIASAFHIPSSSTMPPIGKATPALHGPPPIWLVASTAPTEQSVGARAATTIVLEELAVAEIIALAAGDQSTIRVGVRVPIAGPAGRSRRGDAHREVGTAADPVVVDLGGRRGCEGGRMTVANFVLGEYMT